MSHDLTLVSQWTTDDIAVPDDGDDLEAISVENPIQMLADRVSLARAALLQHMESCARIAVTGSSNTVFSVVVSGLISMLLDSNGIYRPHWKFSDTTLGLADVEGSPANLSNSTWYYVYAKSPGTNTAAPTLIISTLGPDASQLARSDSLLYRYIGCFVTSSAGVPLPLRASRGRYLYRRSAITAPGPLNVIATATEVGWTDLSLAALVPPHSRVVIIDANLNATGGSAYLDLRTKGDTGDVSLHILSNTNDVHGSVEMETDSSQRVQYTLALGSGSDSYGQIWVMGFVE